MPGTEEDNFSFYFHCLDKQPGFSSGELCGGCGNTGSGRREQRQRQGQKLGATCGLAVVKFSRTSRTLAAKGLSSTLMCRSNQYSA